MCMSNIYFSHSIPLSSCNSITGVWPIIDLQSVYGLGSLGGKMWIYIYYILRLNSFVIIVLQLNGFCIPCHMHCNYIPCQHLFLFWWLSILHPSCTKEHKLPSIFFFLVPYKPFYHVDCVFLDWIFIFVLNNGNLYFLGTIFLFCLCLTDLSIVFPISSISANFPCMYIHIF